jgi:hypothetical protein
VLELTYTAHDMTPFAEDVWQEADDGLRAAIEEQWRQNGEGASSELRVASGAAAGSAPTRRSPLATPFWWLADRRALIRAELDAYYAALYGLSRKQLRYILDPHGLSEKELEDILDPWEDPTCSGPHLLPETCALDFPGETFRVLKEKEEREFGEYRTRRLVLEAWDRLSREGLLPDGYDQRVGIREVASRESGSGPTSLPPYLPVPSDGGSALTPSLPDSLTPRSSAPTPHSLLATPSPSPGDRVLISGRFRGVIQAITAEAQGTLDLGGSPPKLRYQVVIDGTGEVKHFISPPARVEVVE